MPWREPSFPGEFPSLGELVADWIESWVAIPDGDHMGEPYSLVNEMRRFLVWYYRLNPETGRFVYNGAQFMRSQKYGKAVKTDTPVPTTHGWRKAIELLPGDEVFTADGSVTRILSVSPIWLNEDCYRVSFSDGESIVCSGDHLWVVEDCRGPRHLQHMSKTIETRRLYEIGVIKHGARRWRLPLPKPLQYAEKMLPVEPYVLGVWLGDGEAKTGRVSKPDQQIFDRMAKVGYHSGPPTNSRGTRSVYGLVGQLRDLGVLDKKHVPEVYLRSSVGQRLELLRGLMDTDGYADERGQCEWTTTTPALRDAMADLLASFGIRYNNVREGIGRLDGVEKKRFWRFNFSTRLPIFTLDRKAERLNKAGDGSFEKWHVRHISAIEPVDSTPTRCITIDHLSGEFLVGKRIVQTHNSPFAGAICLAEALGPVVSDGWDAAGEPVGRPRPTPLIQLAAVSEEQVGNTYRALLEEVRQGPLVDWPGLDPGEGRIILPDGGRIEPVTAAARSRLGARVTFVILDESHLFISNVGAAGGGHHKLAANLKRNLAGMKGRWIETTNAYDPAEASVAQETAECGAVDVYIDHRQAPEWVSLDNTQELRRALRKCYGDATKWVDIDRIIDEIRRPTTNEMDARRFFLSQIVAGASDLVDAIQWDGFARPRDTLVAGDLITLGFDGSKTRDATALIACRVRDQKLFTIRVWERPERADEDWHVPAPEVDATVQQAFANYDVAALFADPWFWIDFLDKWSALYPKKIIEHPTNKDVKIDAAVMRFLTAFKDARITHDGSEVLTRHVKNTVLVKGGKKPARGDVNVAKFYMRPAKRQYDKRIDAAVAAILAVEARGWAVEHGALDSEYNVLESVW